MLVEPNLYHMEQKASRKFRKARAWGGTHHGLMGWNDLMGRNSPRPCRFRVGGGRSWCGRSGLKEAGPCVPDASTCPRLEHSLTNFVLAIEVVLHTYTQSITFRSLQPGIYTCIYVNVETFVCISMHVWHWVYWYKYHQEHAQSKYFKFTARVMYNY